MLIEGGIYNDNYQERVCFIFLKEDNQRYYGVDIENLTIDQFKKQCIDGKLLTFKKNKELKELYYWQTDEEYLTECADGYLGKVDNDLYLSLCYCLKKDDVWICYHS